MTNNIVDAFMKDADMRNAVKKQFLIAINSEQFANKLNEALVNEVVDYIKHDMEFIMENVLEESQEVLAQRMASIIGSMEFTLSTNVSSKK